MEPLTTLFPWMEYVTRAGWTPDGKRYCLVLFTTLYSDSLKIKCPVQFSKKKRININKNNLK